MQDRQRAAAALPLARAAGRAGDETHPCARSGLRGPRPLARSHGTHASPNGRRS
jgi:hypothetical protein